MELTELFVQRRSIRAYKENTEITREEIEKMVAGAQLAPSWKNSQTGRYYAAVGEAAYQEVMNALPGFNQNSSKNAAALLVTTFVTDRAGFDRDGNPDNELGNEWGAYDLGLQSAYLILKAKEMGYDSLIMGLRDADALRKIFQIPENERIAAVIALGVRAAEPSLPQRKPLEKVLTVK